MKRHTPLGVEKAFFDRAPRDSSRVKRQMVTEYFDYYMRVMARNGKIAGYVDLFAGPGIYGGGEESIPILICKQVVSDARLRASVKLWFNEGDPENFGNQQVFSTMRRAHWHQFQVLTKRSGRLLALDEQIDWPPNVWMGVSVESAPYKSRIDHLRKTSAAVKFLSLEPLIDDLGTLDLENIDWVIVGGESGPGARPIEKAWVDGICRKCMAAKVPFFFKQWGGVQKKRTGRKLNGRTYDEMPLSSTAPTELRIL